MEGGRISKRVACLIAKLPSIAGPGEMQSGFIEEKYQAYSGCESPECAIAEGTVTREIRPEICTTGRS
jgi:hypothetical protein